MRAPGVKWVASFAPTASSTKSGFNCRTVGSWSRTTSPIFAPDTATLTSVTGRDCARWRAVCTAIPSS